MFHYHYNNIRRFYKTACPSGISELLRRFGIALPRSLLPFCMHRLRYSAGGLVYQRLPMKPNAPTSFEMQQPAKSVLAGLFASKLFGWRKQERQ